MTVSKHVSRVPSFAELTGADLHSETTHAPSLILISASKDALPKATNIV